MIVMLKIIPLSFIIALICAGISTVFSIIINRKDDYFELKNRIIGGIVLLLIDFGYMMIVFYCGCYSITFISAAMCIWPCLLVEAFIIFFYNVFSVEHDDEIISEWIITGSIAIIALAIHISVIFAPAQNLTYVHDMENVDITYAIPSDEILAKIELKVDDAFHKKYAIEEAEMRQVNGKNIAVYKVADNTGEGSTEYIPGYFIQEENELPKLVTKRIYYDESYMNKWDALRTIRRKYPTVILGDHKFDIDDDWNSYEVYCYREKMFSSNGDDYGIIILNLKDGKIEKYPVSEGKIPAWVDFETNIPR